MTERKIVSFQALEENQPDYGYSGRAADKREVIVIALDNHGRLSFLSTLRSKEWIDLPPLPQPEKTP